MTPQRRVTQISLMLAMIVAAGTLGYVLIEGWSVFDALFMTVITVATPLIPVVRVPRSIVIVVPRPCVPVVAIAVILVPPPVAVPAVILIPPAFVIPAIVLVVPAAIIVAEHS